MRKHIVTNEVKYEEIIYRDVSDYFEFKKLKKAVDEHFTSDIEDEIIKIHNVIAKLESEKEATLSINFPLVTLILSGLAGLIINKSNLAGTFVLFVVFLLGGICLLIYRTEEYIDEYDKEITFYKYIEYILIMKLNGD